MSVSTDLSSVPPTKRQHWTSVKPVGLYTKGYLVVTLVGLGKEGSKVEVPVLVET